MAQMANSPKWPNGGKGPKMAKRTNSQMVKWSNGLNGYEANWSNCPPP